FRQVVEGAVGEGPRLVDVGRYVDDPDVLSVGMRLELEQRLAGVADEAGVDGVINELVAQVQQRAGQSFASDAIPPGR
ncbi:MAG: hypothetical protein GTO03_06445, partial [Planctomycetales bacterium]|nr:hypothetical protein [Planctomycetales bacterium]